MYTLFQELFLFYQIYYKSIPLFLNNYSIVAFTDAIEPIGSWQCIKNTSTSEYSLINPFCSCFSHNSFVLHFFVPRCTTLPLAVEMEPVLNFYSCLVFHLILFLSVICHCTNFTSLDDLFRLTSSITMLEVVLGIQLHSAGPPSRKPNLPN